MKHPVVYRVAGLAPRNLSAVRFHGERTGGDLSHVVPPELYDDLGRFEAMTICYDKNGNRRNDDDFDWVKGIHNEIAEAADGNTAAQVQSYEDKGNRKEARRRKKQGRKKPYREQKSGGPLREVLLSVNAAHFQKEGAKAGEWDTKKVVEFLKYGTEFLEAEHGNSLRYLRVDLDEDGPHFHAVIVPWEDTKTVGGVKQKRLEPAKKGNYDTEKAQDRVGAYMSQAGLVRGERAAQARREAKARGKAPDARRVHVRPSEWRKAKAWELNEREADLSKREAAAEQVLSMANYINEAAIAVLPNADAVRAAKAIKAQKDIDAIQARNAAKLAKKSRDGDTRRKVAIAKHMKAKTAKAKSAKAAKGYER